VELLTSLLEQHAELTGSTKAYDLLSEGAALAGRFRIVVPHDLRRVGARAPVAVLERVA
jgi:glutamate synthase domain-containing protein 3